jgi:hypothetical protein
MSDKILEDKLVEEPFASVVPDSGSMQVEEKTAQVDSRAAEGPNDMYIEVEDDSSEDDAPATPKAHPIPTPSDVKGKSHATIPGSSITVIPHPPLKGMKALQVYHLLQDITALVLERPLTYGAGTLIFGTKCIPWRKQNIDMKKIYTQEPGFEGKVDLPTLRSRLRDQWHVYVCYVLMRGHLANHFPQSLRSF